MASSADGLGPSEVATPVVADLGPSQETGNSTADDSNGLPTGLTTSVWTGEHPTILAAVEDAAYYRSLIPRYEEYFKDREILNHPEEWTIMRRVVTMVVHDINQGRLTSVDKDILASALIACGVKPLMIQKSNYANYDILLESEEKAREAAAKVHKSKNLKMEPMYMGRRHTTLTLYNVPVNITKECLGAYFARWGDVETIIAGRLKCGVFSANWRISMKTTTADYEKIPDYLICRGQQVTVVVEGRKGYCFSCRQQGHLARDCPLRKTKQQQQQPQQQPTPKTYAKASTPTAPTATAVKAPEAPTPATHAPATTPVPADVENQAPDVQEINEGFWSLATGKGCKSHKSNTPPASPVKPVSQNKPVSPSKPAAPKGYTVKTTAQVNLTSTKNLAAPTEGTRKEKTKADPKASKRRAATSDEEAAPKPKVVEKKKKPSKTKPTPTPSDDEAPMKSKKAVRMAQKSRSTPTSKPNPEPSEAPAVDYTAPPKTPVQDLPSPDVSLPTPSTPSTVTLSPTAVPMVEDLPTPSAPIIEDPSTPSVPVSPPTAIPVIPPITSPPPPISSNGGAPCSQRESRGRSGSIMTRSQQAPSRTRSSGPKMPFKEGVKCLEIEDNTFNNLSVPMKTILNALKKRKTFKGRSCEDPRNFPHARLVMTLVRVEKNCKAWELIDYAKKAFPDISMVDMGNDEDKKLKTVRNKVSGRLPIYLHPSLYRSLKLTYPNDVGVIVRDGHVPHDHGHGNLGLHAGQLSLEDFEPVCDKE